MSYFRRIFAIAITLVALGAVGVVFGPHRDQALAQFEALVASYQVPVALPGGVDLMPAVQGATVNGSGIRYFSGRTNMTVEHLFDYYGDGFRVFDRQQNEEGGTLTFATEEAVEAADSLRGLGTQMYVLHAVRPMDATFTHFYLAAPEPNFDLAAISQAEIGESGDGDLPDVPRYPSAERLLSNKRELGPNSQRRSIVYKAIGDPGSVLDYYTEVMPQYGWTGQAAVAGEAGFLIFQKGGSAVNISVAADEDDPNLVYTTIDHASLVR